MRDTGEYRFVCTAGDRATDNPQIAAAHESVTDETHVMVDNRQRSDG